MHPNPKDPFMNILTSLGPNQLSDHRCYCPCGVLTFSAKTQGANWRTVAMGHGYFLGVPGRLDIYICINIYKGIFIYIYTNIYIYIYL